MLFRSLRGPVAAHVEADAKEKLLGHHGMEFRIVVAEPNHVLLHHDQLTVLRFRNHDTELHTVVAKELFLGVGLNVGGNGAPEFGPDGLKRVIIPPEGLIEIQFTPTRTGTFSYLCDMPGHDMKAVIVIE